MQLAQRPFRDDMDKARMAALVALQAADHLHTVDLPYRLSSWAFDEPENVALWETADGTLLGWSVLQSPFWAIELAAHPDAPPSLSGEMLAWADQRARAINGPTTGARRGSSAFLSASTSCVRCSRSRASPTNTPRVRTRGRSACSAAARGSPRLRQHGRRASLSARYTALEKRQRMLRCTARSLTAQV